MGGMWCLSAHTLTFCSFLETGSEADAPGMIHASKWWKLIRVTEFERRQMQALRQERDEEYEEEITPLQWREMDTLLSKKSSTFRAWPAHRTSLRFRLHGKDLPGRPDLVFPKHRLVVFVPGCFWHRHGG